MATEPTGNLKAGMAKYKRGSAAWKRAERKRRLRRRGEQIAFFGIVFMVIAVYFFLVIAR